MRSAFAIDSSPTSGVPQSPSSTTTTQRHSPPLSPFRQFQNQQPLRRMIRFPSSAKSPTTNNSNNNMSDGASTPSFWQRKPRKASADSQVSTASTPQVSPLRARSASATSEGGGLTAPGAGLSSSGRRRLNSRDIPRTYSGLYGNGDDLLPFELNRHYGGRNGGIVTNVWMVLGLYTTFLAMLQLASMLLVSTDQMHYSWTLTNIIHCAVTLVYIHWIKGSMYLDDSGELEAMTLWEQLEATQGTRRVRELLMVVPCVLTWVACHAADYDKHACVGNCVLWVISLLGKLPFMNGVRLFGINRTAGIDDMDVASTNSSSVVLQQQQPPPPQQQQAQGQSQQDYSQQPLKHPPSIPSLDNSGSSNNNTGEGGQQLEPSQRHDKKMQ